ncbi:hypothetical protein [Paenibacillus ginsengarvi]|uniref:Novel STAND NTPase 5 domain-containing protein n=1 Tax=Paenibacillus ginsengarvi TaxID=400777 RepID=A0A3B0CFJ4_9BACL|nr:hypothetical protein [Paenibacillus ginsengarvi]RKN84040.1 hypothetical protein D7M11_15835 [Paenibacillus ginsengarvi]
MGKKKTSKKKKEVIKPIRASIEQLEQSRTGGQIALSGFSYQFLYSCYLILSESNENTTFHLEGIEDIDHYKCEVSSKGSTHIQLKYSTQKQDASFLKDVLKNFLEAYLFDASHNFKLVYDFSIAKGNLSKIFDNSLDESSTKYWKGIVQDIKTENSNWNWMGYSFDSFIKKLSFEKQNKNDLSEKIEKLLIEKYDITTGNIALFANGIKLCCLEKMERRESINQQQLNTIIQSIKDDISKGSENRAHSWIKKLDFNISSCENDFSYYEGKKATPQDIVMQLPVRRINTEKEIEESIQNNRVTVIKASSGQGKTTMALQVAFNLCSEYAIYQLVWCNDSKELDNIVQYFKSRVKLGEKPLIVIDNLDSQTGEWNRLAQLLQEEVSYHYKLLLTTREDDWYNYSGNLSNVRSLQIVKLVLNEQEAKSIFEVLQKSQKLHQAITDWRSSWTKVSDKKLLIEYVYLLTHGEMISERIAHQISQINKTDYGRIKCEILRKVCFADICGIKVPVSKLVGSILETTNRDYGDLLKSVENEFLIRVNTTEKYVEGLHPVRSQHIVDKLHEYAEISDTALQVVKITDVTYLPKLFSNLPHLITNKKNFYSNIIEILWDANNMSPYVLALKGLLSGGVTQYYVQNQSAFDDANNHGGLYLLSTDLNPFTQFEEFEFSVQTLSELIKITPDNANIKYLCDLRDSVPKIVLSETDLYYFCEELFTKLKTINLNELIDDIPSYASIAYWLLNIDRKFNLSKNISLEAIWAAKENYTINDISSIMYTCFCGDKETYTSFVKDNLQKIMTYLKKVTTSLNLFLSEDGNKIHVEYILLPSETRKGNEESVSRLMVICKTLPIFEVYCADAIKPTLDIISGYNIPDDAHKAMPLRNIIIVFHQEFASLWDKTIMSNYECDSILEWLNRWFTVRRNIATLSEECTASICKLLEGKPLGNLATEIDNLRTEINKELIREYSYPHQDRPFEEKAVLPKGFSKVKADYFGGIQNFCNQLVKFLLRDPEQSRLAMINLTIAHSSLHSMQKYFGAIVDEHGMLLHEHNELCVIEERSLQFLIITCEYFKEHMPSKYFNKYAIKSWYSKKYNDLMIDSKTALNGLSEDFLLTYPVKYYNDGILKFYPIIVDNLDITNPEVLMNFLYLCTPIASMDYSYLVIANKNKQSQIIHNGFRVPIQFLKDLKVAVDTEDEELIQSLSPPFPEEIAKQFLDCFEQKYELFIPARSEYEGVDSILELLWAYSRSRKELTADSDSKYLSSIESDLKEKIISLLKKIENQMPYNDFCELTQICDDTFKGSTFDDNKLNAFNKKLITRVLEQVN